MMSWRVSEVGHVDRGTKKAAFHQGQENENALATQNTGRRNNKCKSLNVVMSLGW